MVQSVFHKSENILIVYSLLIAYISYALGKPSKKKKNYEISQIVKKRGGGSSPMQTFVRKKVCNMRGVKEISKH